MRNWASGYDKGSERFSKLVNLGQYIKTLFLEFSSTRFCIDYFHNRIQQLNLPVTPVNWDKYH